jgi:hypothetical protein
MLTSAPLRVPVELRAPSAREGRWFRLAEEVRPDALLLAQAAPPEIAEEGGPCEVAFHLPGDRVPIACRARTFEVVVGSSRSGDERAEERGLRFLDLDEAARLRIETYVRERLGLT